MWILFVLAGRAVVFSLPIRANRRLHGRAFGTCILLMVTVLGAMAARSSMDRLFLEPFNSKDHYLRTRLADFEEDRHSRIVVIRPETWPSHSRLGVFSTVSDLSQPWVVEPNIQLLLREQGVANGRPDIVILDDVPALERADLDLDLRPYVQQLG